MLAGAGRRAVADEAGPELLAEEQGQSHVMLPGFLKFSALQVVPVRFGLSLQKGNPSGEKHPFECFRADGTRVQKCREEAVGLALLPASVWLAGSEGRPLLHVWLASALRGVQQTFRHPKHVPPFSVSKDVNLRHLSGKTTQHTE